MAEELKDLTLEEMVWLHSGGIGLVGGGSARVLRNAANQIERQQAALAEKDAELTRRQEEEAAYCPEDFGWVEVLKAKDAEIARLKEILKIVDEEYSEAVIQRNTTASELATLKAEMARLKEDYDLSLAFIAQAKETRAELATLKARRCETCQHLASVRDRGDETHAGCSYWRVDQIPEQVTNCSAWTPKETK